MDEKTKKILINLLNVIITAVVVTAGVLGLDLDALGDNPQTLPEYVSTLQSAFNPSPSPVISMTYPPNFPTVTPSATKTSTDVFGSPTPEILVTLQPTGASESCWQYTVAVDTLNQRTQPLVSAPYGGSQLKRNQVVILNDRKRLVFDRYLWGPVCGVSNRWVAIGLVTTASTIENYQLAVVYLKEFAR
jgi:hypothetical protein